MSASIHPAPLRLGPYELVRRIATGGMAEVYLARRGGPHGFQKIVAVKRILPQLAQDADFVAMFVDEARVCARLAHPNVVQVFDFGEQDGELYMAMEYVDGTTGARLVRAAAAKGEEVPLDVALYVALSVLRALEYAHGVRDEDGQPLDLVHRDVSPGNVLIDRAGAVKLTDFGIARAAEMERRTEAGQLKGKLGYMSPEQVVGRDLDPRSDLFTTAIVLAELVMLRPLFSGGSEMDVLLRIRDADLSALDRSAHRVPDDVRAILYRALSRQPELRYPTAAAFADALEEVLRRRRLPVGPGKLAAVVDKLGLVSSNLEAEPDSESGLRQTATLDLPEELLSSSSRPSIVPISSEARDVAPSIYRVRIAGGAELGPLSYPRLVELFATAAVDGDVEIARESGSFRPARELEELTRFVSSSALRWDDSVFTRENGNAPIDRVLLPTRMAQLAVRRVTGALCFRDGRRRKKVYLVAGIPEFVVSTDKRELFGEFLVARGQVLRMEVEMALAMLPRYGGRIGDALVGLGVLRPIELFRGIHQQIQERFLEVFQWRKGDMAFVPGARSHEETFPLGIDPFDIVHRGVRDAYALAEMEAILSPLDEDLIEPVIPPPVRLEAFQFPEREEALLRGLTAPIVLHEWLARKDVLAAGREAALRALFVGLSFDLLRSARWREFVGVPL